MKTRTFISRAACPTMTAGDSRAACPKRLLPLLLLLLTLPAMVQAQDYTYTTNSGTITITGYTGPGGAVDIPDIINGLPVTSIGDYAFSGCQSLTSVTIPDSVTSIGFIASYCTNLTSVTIGNGVTNIPPVAFGGCVRLTAITVDALNSSYRSVDEVLFDHSLTALVMFPTGKAGSYAIPNTVTSIGHWAFYCCASLASVTIPHSVSRIGYFAFNACTGLRGAYFEGNAPRLNTSVFDFDLNCTAYYLPGTAGWDAFFGGCPKALWILPTPVILNNSPSFGVQTNRFGFIISWATNVPVVVEACTNPANPTWSPVSTNTLTSGTSYFSDSFWTNHSKRFYRVRSL